MPIDEAESANARPALSGIRVTATEVVDDVLHVITLERQDKGRYREVSMTPLVQIGFIQSPHGAKQHERSVSELADSSGFIG